MYSRGWVLGGDYTGYYHPPRYPPTAPTPGTHRTHHRCTQYRHRARATNSSFRSVQGDPRGGIRTGTSAGTVETVSALPPPYASTSPARSLAPSPLPYLTFSVFLSISQYISVFLEYLSYTSVISQLWTSVIPRYISVFLSILLLSLETRCWALL